MTYEVPRVTLIAAADPNWVIGMDGRLPWSYPVDLKRFKQLTMGGLLVMGTTTWRSLGRRLPGRRMCVMSRKPPSDLFTPDIDFVATDMKAVRSYAREGEHVWIAGGGEIYKLALESGIVDVIDLTIVPAVDPLPLVGSDAVRLTYFPANLLEGWRSVKETRNEEDRRLIHRRYERLAKP